MKAILAALLLAVTLSISVPAATPAAPAPVEPGIVGMIGFAVDGHLNVIVFVFSDGGIYPVSAKDCGDSADCKAEVAQLVAAKHVRVFNVSTGTKV